MTSDGLRPATPGRLGDHTHRQHLVEPPRGGKARIDGRWMPVVLIAQRQVRDGGPWEVYLEYRPAPGSNRLRWFIVDTAHLDIEDPPDPT